jgi:glycosyltransferase involved in cell wall biosynthesis
VGRWQPWKGLHRALEALDVVRRRYPQARLHIIGPESDAVYARQIRLRIQDLNLADSVIIHGPIPYADLPQWYQSADLLILPSDPGKESFGMVVAESMACGTPVVALSAAQGGPAEMITHAVDGLLVEEAEMGAAIVELCGQPDHLLAMREAARQKVLGHFTRKVTAQILQDIVCST